MNAKEIKNLSVGTRIKGRFGEGTITVSPRYGKGIRFDTYSYAGSDDLHGFNGLSDEAIERLVEKVI